MSPSNYPPGVTGAEPQISGDYMPMKKLSRAKSDSFRLARLRNSAKTSKIQLRRCLREMQRIWKFGGLPDTEQLHLGKAITSMSILMSKYRAEKASLKDFHAKN